ncbi:MAG: type II toxin-antitoxin system RelE/ParE family toxin [Alphaproteobacteria bacterium]
MIMSFKDRQTESLFNGGPAPRFRSFRKVALRKLDMLDAAKTLRDPRVPLGNGLESLKGSRRGQQSVCIIDKWRICFIWEEGACDIEIVDNH